MKNWAFAVPLWLLLSGLLFADGKDKRFYNPGKFKEKSGPKIIFVKTGSEGKGQSWENAFGDLQMALKSAKKGDQIWVAAGIYLPTHDGDRDIAFQLVNEVNLYGGFVGHETTLTERNAAANRTILSGAIGKAGKDDNSFTIIYAEEISAATIIDGFVLSDGNANGTEDGVHQRTCGGAWFNLNASPSISNCTFQNNAAKAGAAIFNYAGKAGVSSPRIVNCNFIDNQADLDGGAIFNNGDNGKCMPRIENSYFENNTATFGAVMMNRAVNGLTKVTLCQCRFISNRSSVSGNVIYNHRTNTGVCVANTQDCFFEDFNEASIRLNNGISTDLAPRYKNAIEPQRLATSNSWCYGDEPEFCQIQGRLYTLAAAQEVCGGKSIPSLEEWLDPLSGYYDDELQQVIGDPNGAYLQIIGDLGSDELKTHELLGGQYDGVKFKDRGVAGYFWTSTARNEQENYVIYFDARDGMVHKGWARFGQGLSCICFEKK